ncbi:cyclic nucleotide-binding domain-containing protein [Corallococcus carmarthensis]|uniref:Cyclic nucleotide-binding domain-containing protein n=1 Tax=Corallococcus carmarthensis TaxID=2316728 RepID=A0A3A8KAC8_9BACT|nr:cyclic nucleotide-binding domain-containing protein [Corallococcus carmarthensis]NOK20147.1 cyclic nucleotide-binding domain-containing protein [Corallococcus carmarthensis]RKG99351.1 cyclic nucleotide-binding domain-containing protein [Corallococcus carmarthensis]
MSARASGGNDKAVTPDDSNASDVAVGPGSSVTRGVWARVMKGAVGEAVRAYEAMGAGHRERVLEEALVVPADTRTRLVEVLRQARDFAGAARLLEADGDDAGAAPLYEQAGAPLLAAEAWLRVGEQARAAAAFERAGSLEQALSLYQVVGARESLAHLLGRMHRPMEAAQVFRVLGNAHAELEMLRAVSVDDAQRPEAVLRMCELLEAEGATWRALVLLADGIKHATGSGLLLLQAEQARLLQQLGLASAPEGAAAAEKAPPVVDGYGYLKAIPIFDGLSLEDMRDLYRLARPMLLPAGTTVLEKGAKGMGLVVLLEGMVSVSTGPGRDARQLNMLGPGAFLGEISLILDGPVSAHVRAHTVVRALRVTRTDFQYFLETHEAAALRIYRLFTQSLAERVRDLSS